MGFFGYFGTVIIVSLFWSFLITSTLHFMPDADRNVIIRFNCEDSEDCAETNLIRTDLGDVTQEFESNLQDVKSFGIVDLAALALYSGNLVLDLAVNFFFAIPEMFYLLFYGIFSLLHIDGFIQEELLIWIQSLFAIIATMILLQFILGIRTISSGAV